MRKNILMLFVVAVSAGCQTFDGVIVRRATVPFVPEPAEMKAAIASVPGIQHLEYRKFIGGRPLTLTGIKPAGWGMNFYYKTRTNEPAPTFGNITLEEDYKGKVSYTHSVHASGGTGSDKAKELLLQDYPVMIAIEKQLESIGLTNLAVSATERRSKNVRDKKLND